MSTELLLVICVVVAVILLRFVLPKTAWFRRLHVRWLAFRIAWNLHKMKQSLDSPKSKLKWAREAVEGLRAGFWMYPVGKIYLESRHISERMDCINEALEAGFSYEQIGTTREEVIGFRNGEAHKTSARLQVESFRRFEEGSRDYYIIQLAEDAGFNLEDVGTSVAELASLSREYSRRLQVGFVERFRKWAMGQSNISEDPDEFAKQISELLSEENYVGRFTYEELGTSEQEYLEMMRLARRRQVEGRINLLKQDAERGDTHSSIVRKMIRESLEKAGLTLADFNIAESDLDEIERSAYIAKAREILDELRRPGEGWFYSPPPVTNPNVRFYRPALWECIPGDPLVFVKGIKENLAAAHATLADIETSEAEIKALVCAGHFASAKFLIEELKRVSQTPRRTQFERTTSMLGPKMVIMDDPKNPIDHTTFEDAYPVERDIQAIEYHLRGAEIGLEEIGSSQQKLQELRTAIESR